MFLAKHGPRVSLTKISLGPLMLSSVVGVIWGAFCFSGIISLLVSNSEQWRCHLCDYGLSVFRLEIGRGFQPFCLEGRFRHSPVCVY